VRLSGATLRVVGGRTVEVLPGGEGVPLFLGGWYGMPLGAFIAPAAWCFQTPGDAAQAARGCGWAGFTVEEAPVHGEDASPTVAVYVDPCPETRV
jgi:hypothetical protein